MHFQFERVNLGNGRTLEIWNTSDSERFYLSHAAIVVYDITQRRSVEKAKELVDEFAEQTRPGAFVALVGNKADLESRREVTFKVQYRSKVS